MFEFKFQFLNKKANFQQIFNFWTKFWFLNKILVLQQNFGFESNEILSNIKFQTKRSNIEQSFKYWIKLWILNVKHTLNTDLKIFFLHKTSNYEKTWLLSKCKFWTWPAINFWITRETYQKFQFLWPLLNRSSALAMEIFTYLKANQFMSQTITESPIPYIKFTAQFRDTYRVVITSNARATEGKIRSRPC